MSYLNLWAISPKDYPSDEHVSEQIAFFCKYGALAPSVHNTQPWKFHITNDELKIYIALERSLKYGDATTRQAWISIGACLENIVRAGRCFGFNVVVDSSSVTAGKENSFLKLKFNKANVHCNDDLKYITMRFSDRSSYDTSPLAPDIIRCIEGSNKLNQTKTVITVDRETIKRVADLTARGIKAAFSNPYFRHELARLIQHQPLKPLGFTSASLRLGGMRGLAERHIVRHGINSGTQSDVERKRILSSGGLVFIFSKGDTPAYWIDAGRALQAAALEATKLGLRTSFSAAVIEAFDFHEEIESILETSGRLLAIMRIGTSQAKPVHTPRLRMEQVIK